jgi:uncharacterized protein YndB with AHSA1/START domain
VGMAIEEERSVVEAETFSVRRSIRIEAAVDAVWRAVTEPALVSQWFGELTLTPAADGSVEGATGLISWPDHGSIPIRVEAVDAPRSVTYGWNNDDARGAYPAEYDPASATRFTFTLTAEGEGTRLTLVETGFDATSDAAANMEDHRGGWDFELDELRDLVTS